jgi:hypothetical protein
MSEQKTNTNLNLVWGAKKIKDALNLETEQQVFHLARKRVLPGLKKVGGKLCLDTVEYREKTLTA